MHFPIPLRSFVDFKEYRLIDPSMIVYIKFTLVITKNFNNILITLYTARLGNNFFSWLNSCSRSRMFVTGTSNKFRHITFVRTLLH